MKDELLFSVIIPTYLRPIKLINCLEALLQQSLQRKEYEIIVVDNDSNGSAEDVVKKTNAGGHGVIYKKRASNNVSEARNLGARVAGGQWLAFLDDDCVAPPVWLERAAHMIRINMGKEMVLGGDYLLPGEQVPPASDPEMMPEGRYLPEGNLFMPRKLYLNLGGMNPELGPNEKRFGYHEGTDLQMRIEKQNSKAWPRILARELAVYHYQKAKNHLITAFLSGLDLGRLKGGRAQGDLFYTISRIAWLSVRLFGRVLSEGAEKSVRRELFRIGEIWGTYQSCQGRNGSSARGQTKSRGRQVGQKKESMSPTRNLFRALMRGLRKANNRRVGHFTIPSQGVVDNEKLRNFLQRSGPFMAGKIGTTELLALEYSDRWIRPLWPKVASWERAAERLLLESGVFPKSRQQFNQFLSFYKDAIQQLDAVHVWQEDLFLRNYEEKLLEQHCPFAMRIVLGAISTNILAWIAGGQWLVVSPFIDTMRSQSNRLADVHQGKSWAPLLAGLETRCTFVRCPFFSHMMSSPFSSWTEGLDKLGETILEKKFDYALIGAGAWSLPLAAKIKRAGRKAIHLGGETQLVFGIKGKRWENFNLYNEHWVRPSPEETPAGHEQKEKGCYW